MRRFVGIALLGAGLAGCGQSSPPRLQSADATRLIALAHRIAGEDACSESRDIPRLRAQAIALVNKRRVPPALQEPLLSGVQALAAETPLCMPSVPVVTNPPPTPKPHGPPRHPSPPGHGPRHGHGHGHDK